ncbi:MAG: hypothetical protein M1816_000844 [Peltula sp. TS41687]|nr:MAG: hypothetical protein M1816_000844 [Peltula sp. TS41687]
MAEDEFKWPGEGFEGFPRRVPEDCVCYSLYLVDSSNDKRDGGSIRKQLEEVQAAATDLKTKLLRDYIWQREGFNLEYCQEDGLIFLRGRTDYGDSIEDEWVVVYLLRELSKQYQHLWISALDSDGQFLLVEAANVLPRWLNPDVANNRVWLHNGTLLIIRPLSSLGETSSTAGPTQSLSIQEAFGVIKSNPESLLHSPSIEAEAFYRLRNYPDQIKDNLHHAIITIPRKLAFILKLKPAFISPAVEAFYLRDPIALRPWQKETSSDQSPMTFPPHDLVSVSVIFPKVAYAQIRSQPFRPPPGWDGLLDKKGDTNRYNQLETGMKVTCGFEMLSSDPQNKERDHVVQTRRLLHSLQAGELKQPSDDEISRWEKKQDDESWLDVNFEEFEKELAASSSSKTAKGRDATATAFGDKTAQENLRRIVQRFEDFLNDETAGADGVDSDDEDDDEDEDEHEHGNLQTEGEDTDVSFDEKEFARMMREMMGLPPDTEDEVVGTAAKGKQVASQAAEDAESDGGEMHEIMQRMEEELDAAGALDLDPTPKKITAVRKATRGTSKERNDLPSAKAGVNEADVNWIDEEVDIDFNLAKNLLESFKSQAGLPGPGGNLLGSLGLKLPRDEDDDDVQGK